jgi:5-(carboxyamino)imidazole ribonucleotide mutase
MDRETLAAAFEDLAARLREGKGVEVGDMKMDFPDKITVERELEIEDGEVEFEIEVKWSKGVPETKPLVGILTGSPSDLEMVKKAQGQLEALGIPCELKVLSAHRTPDLTVTYVKEAEKNGIELFIACAGMAAHLAGVVASHTRRPVIGVPLTSGALSGLDSLLSTVQMPPGVPVATVAVDGTKNAAFLAAQILSLKYPEIADRLKEAAAEQRKRYESGS